LLLRSKPAVQEDRSERGNGVGNLRNARDEQDKNGSQQQEGDHPAKAGNQEGLVVRQAERE